MTLILQLEGITEVGPGSPSNTTFGSSALTVSPAVKISKRRRKFNLNVSSIQAGIEEESETTFFDRLVGEVEPSMLEPATNGEEHKASSNRGFQSESDDSKDRKDIRELQYALRDTMEAVDEQQKLQVGARHTDSTIGRHGLPRHGQYCEAFDGQFLHMDSDGTADFVAVAHGLRRPPQGAIFIRNGREAEVIIEGVSGASPPVPPANQSLVYVRHHGQDGNFSVFILF